MDVNISNLSDIQSESGVIGTLIYHPDYIAHTDYLKPNHFYNKENACIYWSIQELFKEGITNIDAYNISNKLQSHKGVQNTIEKYNIPSIQEFIELYKEAARHSIEEYKMLAENIVTFAFKRDLIKVLYQIESKCYKPEYDLEKMSHMVYSELDKLTQNFLVASDIDTLGANIDSIWEEIEDRRTADGIYGIPSKFPSFMDYFTYEPGELVVIQAKYKQGKSVLIMNEVVHKLKNGIACLVVDREMPTRLYVERLLSHLTGIELKKIKTGRYGEAEERKIKETISWIKQQPFVHIYDPNMTMERLYSICKSLQNKMNLGFVAYDYLKSNETSASDNYNLLGAKCDFLKNNIAGELDIPVLAACQLNREGKVADSFKINMFLSVGIKWGYKSLEMQAKDGMDCGNAYAKIYVNRLGRQMDEDSEDDYIDFYFDGDTMTIVEAKQHEKDESY